MKGGNMHKIRGKHFSVALIALVFITVSLWSLETKPLVTTLLSVEDRLYLPSPDVILAASHVAEDIVKPKDHPIEEDSHLYEKTGSETMGLVSDGSDVGSIVSSRAEEDARNSTSSVDNNDKKDAHQLAHKDAHQLDHKDSKSPIEKRVCNYAKGRWVVDNKRALYSGSQCKQWLSEMWACRLTQRLDFSYETYRWQPENCEMPEFNRSEFLERMRDKTIAFVGDSLGRQQFQSLMCMVTGGEDNPQVQDVGNEYGFTLAPGSVRPDGWAFRFPETNTTILYHWSACLCDLEPLNSTNPAGEVAMHLDRPPSFLKRFLPSFDVLILNTGHHWNRGKVNANHWVMYVDGKPLKNKRLLMIGNAKNLTVHSTAKWVDNQIRYHHRQVKAFFRTISPRHFFNGEWNTGGSCENTTPLAKGSEVVQDESSDPLIAGAVKGTKVKLLDITALSTLRDEGHISRYSVRVSAIQDCLHWCLPGIPDTWNEIFAAQI